MVPAASKRIHVILRQTGRHVLPKPVRLEYRKSWQKPRGKAFGSLIPFLQEDSMPALIFSRPKPVLTITASAQSAGRRFLRLIALYDN